VIVDSKNDADQALKELRRGGGHALLVRTLEDPGSIEALLRSDTWDVIIADYSMPDFKAAKVLSILRSLGLEIPVLVLSSNLGEEVAVAAMRAGASDYLLKRDLTRLPSAVTRALKEASDHKQATAALRASEDRYREVVEAMQEGVVTYDAQGNVEACNKSGERILGLSVAEIADRYRTHGWDPVREDHSSFPEDEYPTTLCRKTGLPQSAVVGVRRGDDTRWLSVNASPLLTGSHAPFPVVASLTDITAWKLAEDQRRAREASFRLLFESNPQPMWVFDRETRRFLEVNEAAVVHYGYSRDEFLAMRIDDIRPPEDVPKLLEDLSHPHLGVDRGGAWRHVVRDGRVIDVEIVSHPLQFEGRAAEIVVAQDTTERNALEARLLQSQKMDALGRLAGGVAHDFNNVLGIIMGYGDMALAALQPEDPLRRRLEQIQKAASRAADLTRQLLTFSRHQVVEQRVIDINEAVTEAAAMLEHTLGEDIVLKTALAKTPFPVQCDPGQLQQVIVNLAVNARDAMPKGGTLIIETQNVSLGSEYATTHPETVAGDYVMLAVSDTGRGMDRATRDRVFEPFFTTKGRGKGTGLGLATVYGIVTQNGGHVEVYSEEGVGSTFKVYLPRKSAAKAPPPVEETPTVSRANGETVLVIEDEAALGDIVAEVLEGVGYLVLRAANTREAIDLMAVQVRTVDLVLSDVVMPGGASGPEIEKHLPPGTPVVYMSGYTDEAIDEHGLVERGAHFIHKPFSPAALLALLRTVVGPPKS
jgi:PAS domain S-box-containing protein